MKLSEETRRIIFDHGILSYVEVASVDEAIELALELKQAGKYDLFRGQANSTWRVASSAERVGAAKRDEVLQTFMRFWQWAKGTPEMEQYLAQREPLWAIAQHYGLKTPFIDLTDDPSIAGFFALDFDAPEDGQMASIICLKESDFDDFWKGSGYGAHLLQAQGIDCAPEIVRIDVSNLWRLQKQRGCFLWNPVGEIERIYNFDRIVFPFSWPRSKVALRDDIYPSNQSHLERLLTNFFVTERMRENDDWIKSIAALVPYVIEIPEGYDDGRTWPQGEVSDDESWIGAGEWRVSPSEHAREALPGWMIEVSGNDEDACKHLMNLLVSSEISLRRNGGISIRLENPTVFGEKVVSCIKKQWNGMRLLPFTDEEVGESLRTTLSLLSKDTHSELEAEHETDGASTNNVGLVYVEFAESSTSSQSYSRANVSASSLQMAFSEHFRSAAMRHLGEDAAVKDMVGLPCRPKYRFTYAGLRTLMVSELIPSQITTRGLRTGDESMYETLIYSPVDLEVFGLA